MLTVPPQGVSTILFFACFWQDVNNGNGNVNVNRNANENGNNILLIDFTEFFAHVEV